MGFVVVDIRLLTLLEIAVDRGQLLRFTGLSNRVWWILLFTSNENEEQGSASFIIGFGVEEALVFRFSRL